MEVGDGKLPLVGLVLLLGPGSGGLGSSVRRLVRARAGGGGMATARSPEQNYVELAHWQRLLMTMP